MIYLEFCEDRMLKDADVQGDPYLNAKQLASLMVENEGLAKIVAMALPFYVHLTEETSLVYAQKMMEVVEDDFHNHLVQAGTIE
ncbi:MAG: hypothetical protein ACK5PR_03615 [bacterium]|jgi:hypothetical protein